MMATMFFIIALSLGFDFLNGIHDSSNVVATMISSRAVPPRLALTITALAEFTGPFLFGVAVANTIGHEIIDSTALNLAVILAALLSAIFWNLFTWYFGIPSSSSHALIGGLIGAVVYGVGFQAINVTGMQKVLVTLFTSPVIGFFGGMLIMRMVIWLSRNATPNINNFFKRAQLITGLALAFSHGTNDAQKTMGVITLSLVLTGYLPSFQVPMWVIAMSAGAIALGTATGGWRLIRTLGAKFYKIRPVHGFSAQLTSACVILGASMLGGPVSTTQVVSSSIMGVGTAERINMVRWHVAGEIAMAWLFTIPSTALVAAGISYLLSIFFPQLTGIR